MIDKELPQEPSALHAFCVIVGTVVAVLLMCVGVVTVLKWLANG